MRQLPLLTEFDQLCAANRSRYGSFVAQSSGTSGEPLRFLLDKPSNVLEFVYYWQHWSWAGYRLGMRFAELSSAHFLQRPSHLHRNYVFQRGFGRLLLNSSSISAARVRDFAEAIRKYRPIFLKGTPSSLFSLAALLSDARINDLSFRAIFSTGEILLPEKCAAHAFEDFGFPSAHGQAVQGGYRVLHSLNRRNEGIDR